MCCRRNANVCVHLQVHTCTSKTKISASEVHILSLFPAHFQPFFAKIWREYCLLIWPKKFVWELLQTQCTFCFFQKYHYFSEDNIMFYQNLKFNSASMSKTNQTYNNDFLTWILRGKCQEDIVHTYIHT